MRQMPSVTDTTVPWVRTSAESARLWMRFLISSLISEALSCCMVTFLGLLVSQCGGHRCELAAHRTVYHFVADLHPHAADQFLVYRHLRFHLALEAALEIRGQRRGLRGVQRQSALHHGIHHAFALILQREEEAEYLGREREPPVLDQHVHEILHLLVERVTAQRGE